MRLSEFIGDYVIRNAKLKSQLQVRQSEELRQPSSEFNMAARFVSIEWKLCVTPFISHSLKSQTDSTQAVLVLFWCFHKYNVLRRHHLVLANNANDNDEYVHLAFLTYSWNGANLNVAFLALYSDFQDKWNIPFISN